MGYCGIADPAKVVPGVVGIGEVTVELGIFPYNGRWKCQVEEGWILGLGMSVFVGLSLGWLVTLV